LSEAAACAKDQGLTMYDQLLDIYKQYGLYKEKLISVVKKGKSGAEEIQQMMQNFRKNPPKAINGSTLTEIMDYTNPEHLQKANEKNGGIVIPASDVLQFFTNDGSKISIRPSGTEPKIKFYIGVKSALKNASEYEATNQLLDDKINRIINDLNLK
jgi:phosphoglucomutase